VTSTNLNANLDSAGDPAVSSSSISDRQPGVSAALYARVSSARQKKDETIGSQIAALREYAAAAGLAVAEQWVFEDDGHSGATLTRPALERLRDLVAGVGVEVVVCYSPDRLARKFAYQALLIEEFTRAGTRVQFVKGPRGHSAEDQLLVQFQGMFAEYEKAQIMERYRRGKAHRARAGSVSVLSGAPYGYRYLRKTPHTSAGYEIVAHEAVLVREVFRRYTDDAASIAELARWLGEQGALTRTGKTRWDRSVVWAILRNPAYAGQAVYGKTQAIHEPAALNRIARQAGRVSGRAIRVVERPAEDWVHIRSRRSSPPRRSRGPGSDWPTTSGSPRATPRSRPCCRAWPPAPAAGTPTTAPAPGPPTRRSTTTDAWAAMTTATQAGGSARTSRSAPTTSTRPSGTTSPACSPTHP
jgi:DNA invertase Pin-like site-specific DNA recombinase